jgi:hypothetical protein
LSALRLARLEFVKDCPENLPESVEGQAYSRNIVRAFGDEKKDAIDTARTSSCLELSFVNLLEMDEKN